jgi:WD40 repeat protein
VRASRAPPSPQALELTAVLPLIPPRYPPRDAASADGSVIKWSLESFSRLSAVFGSTFFTSVCYHPDESQFITCGTDHKITFWDATDMAAVRILEGSETVRRAPEAPRRAACRDSARPRQRATATARALAPREKCKRARARCGSVHVRAADLLSSPQARTQRVPPFAPCLPRAQGLLSSLDISRDGEFYVSSSSDRSVKLWHYDEGVCWYTGDGHSGAVERVKISPDEKRLVSIGARSPRPQ